MFIRHDPRRVELFYYPVFKSFKVPTNEKLQRKIVNYLTHHPELKPQKKEPWYRSKVSPGFNHEAMDCYLIVSHSNHWKNLIVQMA